MIGIVFAIAPPEPVGPLPWASLVLGGVAFGAGLGWWGGYLWRTAAVSTASASNGVREERTPFRQSAAPGQCH